LRGRQKTIASLKQRIDASSKEQVVDEVAYTWFNRFAALRILDARDFHPFRVRVLAPLPGETLPELFQHVRVGKVPQELRQLPLNSSPATTGWRDANKVFGK
jgi:hypothetical protein